MVPDGDELDPADVTRLAMIRTEAIRLEAVEGIEVAERHLLAEIFIATEDGRPEAFVAALREELAELLSKSVRR